MTRADRLRDAILQRYKSIRAFAIAMDIPYSTLATALERGVEGMAYGTVIKICNNLDLNPVDLTPLRQNSEGAEQMRSTKVMNYYLKLNMDGRERLMRIFQDYLEIPKYTV